MAEQLQLRRGTAAQVAAFTGAVGELVVNTTNNNLVLQDGVTVGGWPVTLAAFVVGLPTSDPGTGLPWNNQGFLCIGV
jgi:hypothetical protein